MLISSARIAGVFGLLLHQPRQHLQSRKLYYDGISMRSHSNGVNVAAALAAAAVSWNGLFVAVSTAATTEETAAPQTRRLQDESRPGREPTEDEIRNVQTAFYYFDKKELTTAERLFSKAIDQWTRINRPVDEVASLYKARGNVRVDLKQFDTALQDYDTVIEMMKADGAELPDGTARYSEYPDTFVQRGLTEEGLGDWRRAVEDYTRAVDLWGGGRGDGVNPFVLTFRGNALTRVGDYDNAIGDYRAAEAIFSAQHNDERAVDARANLALALYETGKRTEAVKLMRDIVRRVPGYADMHVALAAHAWGERDIPTAEQEWQLTCDRIDVGCRKYKDSNWVSTVRRWPPSLARQLDNFLNRRIE